MRVLLVSQPIDGGVFKHVSDLANALAGRGHQVVVAAPLRSRPASLQAEVVPIPMTRGVAVADDARAISTYVTAMRRIRPDVVHAHSSKAGVVARLARVALPSVPVIYTPHGYAFVGPFSPRSRDVFRLIEQALSPLATRVVCVCDAEQRLAASIGARTRTRVVHNGIDVEEFPRPVPPAGVPDHIPKLAALGLLRPGKGLETLLDAATTLRERWRSLRVVIVGDGPGKSDLRRRAEKNGILDAVDFVPATPAALEEVRRATVFVHPSWAESFPYAVLEAMALALPIVATDVGGIGEAITHGVSGLLVPPADATALAGAITSLLADPASAGRMGVLARQEVERRFTVDRMVDGILAVYNDVVTTR